MNKLQERRIQELNRKAALALLLELNNRGILPMFEDNCIKLPHTEIIIDRTNNMRVTSTSIKTAIALIKENTANAVERGLEPLPEEYRTSGRHTHATWQGKQFVKTVYASQVGKQVPNRVTNVIDSGF